MRWRYFFIKCGIIDLLHTLAKANAELVVVLGISETYKEVPHGLFNSDGRGLVIYSILYTELSVFFGELVIASAGGEH